MNFSRFIKTSQTASYCSILGSILMLSCGKEEPETSAPEKKENAEVVSENSTDDASLHAYLKSLPGQNAVSEKCMECHKDIHHHWQKSQHGQANRLIDMALDNKPFSSHKLDTSSEKWKFTMDLSLIHI